MQSQVSYSVPTSLPSSIPHISFPPQAKLNHHKPWPTGASIPSYRGEDNTKDSFLQAGWLPKEPSEELAEPQERVFPLTFDVTLKYLI